MTTKSSGNNRSATTGRFVTSGQAASHPATTVTESRGPSGSSGEHYRSAISGRYVTNAHGRRSPQTTVKEK